MEGKEADPRSLGPPDLASSIVITYHQIKYLSGGPIPGGGEGQERGRVIPRLTPFLTFVLS